MRSVRRLFRIFNDAEVIRLLQIDAGSFGIADQRKIRLSILQRQLDDFFTGRPAVGADDFLCIRMCPGGNIDFLFLLL